MKVEKNTQMYTRFSKRARKESNEQKLKGTLGLTTADLKTVSPRERVAVTPIQSILELCLQSLFIWQIMSHLKTGMYNLIKVLT